VKLLVACPSRDRPLSAINLSRSFLETTTDAELVFYIDGDQYYQYCDDFDRQGASRSGRIKIEGGERIGPVAAATKLCKKYDPDIFAFVPDDCTFKTPGWDKYAVDLVESMPGKLCVISPAHPFGNHVDIPFVSRAWIEAIGDFDPVGLAQWCWPTTIALLAEIGDIAVRCDPEKFYIDHQMQKGKDADERLYTDSITFYHWCVHQFPKMLDRLRTAIAEAKA
jgi:hypothetical protein